MLIFDAETDGLLDAVTRVHVLVIKDTESGEHWVYRNDDVISGLNRLTAHMATGGTIWGHNAIKYDVPVLRKLYPDWVCDDSLVCDTMVLARMLYPDLWDKDKKNAALPKNLYNSHSLEAWGHRLGLHKGDYKGGWEKWNQEMEDYCVQDVAVTEKLLKTLLKSKLYPGRSPTLLEMAVANILGRQERHGFLINQVKLRDLILMLAKERLKLEQQLLEEFRHWYTPGPVFTPNVNNKAQGYTKDVPFTKVTLTTFNPSSRQHIANRLTKLYGWKPTEFTDNGEPKVDEETMKALPWPITRVIEKYLVIDKRCGQVSEGKEAIVKHVREDGRIHGGVNTIGAITHRMTHSRPNVAQTPSGRALYGHEFRELYCVPPGKALVGCDADGLELRCLAGYMARFDNGAYVDAVLKGDKSKGTDSHSVNAIAIGLDPKAFVHGKETGRDVAKTWFYAFIYGAGDEKLGMTLTRDRTPVINRRIGKEKRASLMANLPALGKIIASTQREAKTNNGYVKGIDGRAIQIRSDHSALNTLLQSAGAILMKKALVILDNQLQEKGYVPGSNYEFVANVHDEWQIECDEGIAESVGQMAADSIRLAGEALNLGCPLAGNYVIGKTWADTH